MNNEESDEEVPVVQLCCLPLAELRTLDLATMHDFSALLNTAVPRIRELLSIESNPPIQAVTEAGGVAILHKAMHHADTRIRTEAT